MLEPLPFEIRKRIFIMQMQEKGLRVSLTNVQEYIIDSCLMRLDRTKAEKLLRDWQQAKPVDWIYKWSPGTHYYALDDKFSTESEARNHLSSKGYECLGVKVSYIYSRQSD